MSIVGPRAEVPEYVALYTDRQRRVLSVRPGLTGPGYSHYAADQEDRFETAADTDRLYIEELMPEKLELDIAYLEHRSARTDLTVILETLRFLAGRPAQR